MALIDLVDAELQLWHFAVKAALGPLSAYLTPENYGLSSVGLSAKDGDDEEFRVEIEKRLDLARAAQVVELVSEIGNDLPQSYRHSVYYCDDRIDGALLIPRLVTERAAGRLKRIPVLRASRFVETPEALLVSESIRLSQRVAAAWRGRGGAEGALASTLSERLATIEAQQPWSSLRLRPRPVLRALASTVRSRTVAGWNALGSPMDRLSDLMLDGSEAVTEAAGPIAFLVSRDRRFEDRLFELICLGWLLGALKAWDPAGKVYPESLRASGPIFSGEKNGLRTNLHYQASYVGKSARYSWRKSGKQLRAIPDFSLELETTGAKLTLLLDAKNRVLSSNSEIVYKLLGYQENLGLDPYFALGIAPAHSGRQSFDGVRHSHREAAVLRLPLATGSELLKRALALWMARFDASITVPACVC